MSLKLTVNKQIRTVDAAPDTPLLWVLRDVLDIKGPKDVYKRQPQSLSYWPGGSVT